MECYNVEILCTSPKLFSPSCWHYIVPLPVYLLLHLHSDEAPHYLLTTSFFGYRWWFHGLEVPPKLVFGLSEVCRWELLWGSPRWTLTVRLSFPKVVWHFLELFEWILFILPLMWSPSTDFQHCFLLLAYGGLSAVKFSALQSCYQALPSSHLAMSQLWSLIPPRSLGRMS